jgi:integrase/recombinase XerC
MRMGTAIDLFIADAKAEGRINSDNTEAAYKHLLYVHAEDVANRDPAKTGREDVKKTLARYTHPRTRKQRHAILTSFYDWCVYEGIRKASPAREVRPVRVKPATRDRLTRDEIVAVLDASENVRRDRWAVALMLYAGLRNAELRGLKGQDLARDGWVHIVGKGGKTRWAPVVPELVPIIDEIRTLVGTEQYVLPGRRPLKPAIDNLLQRDDPSAMLSSSALRKQIMRVGERAMLAIHITPHSLRHCYGDAVTRYAGVRVSQTVLGHASIETTVGTYSGAMTLDELAASMAGFGYRTPKPAAIPADTRRNPA